MALVFTDMATPTHDSRMLHSMTKGLKMAAGDVVGIETDANGEFDLDLTGYGISQVLVLQGSLHHEEDTLVSVTRGTVDDTKFKLVTGAGLALASATTVQKLNFFALGN